MSAIDLQLIWKGNLRFFGSVGTRHVCLDGEKKTGVSPVGLTRIAARDSRRGPSRLSIWGW